MNVRQLSPRYYVTGQITTDDLKIIAANGIKSVINNRPDGEAAGQPKTDDLAAAAADLDLTFVFVPVVSGKITEQNVRDFEQACNGLEGPVLLFCHTGARSTMLWNMSSAS